MSAKTTEAAAPPPKIEVHSKIDGHEPKVGDDVVWYEGGERGYGAAFAGKIVALGFGTQVEIATFEPNMDYLRPRPGVKHISDKSIRDDEKTDNGAWDWTPRFKQMLGLIAQLGEAVTDKK